MQIKLIFTRKVVHLASFSVAQCLFYYFLLELGTEVAYLDIIDF